MVSGGGQLIQSVQEVCDQTRTSARLVQHSNGKVYAFDCHEWSAKAASLFRFQQPNAIVCVEQSVSSLSGFVLIIEEKRAKHASSRILVALTATFFVYAVLWVLYAHTAASGSGDLERRGIAWEMLNFSFKGIFNDSWYHSSNKTNNSNSFRTIYSRRGAENCILKGGNGDVCKPQK